MESTTCEVADSVQACKCQREEPCEDCFMIGHLKECEWCEHQDHPVRKLEVKHLASEYPTDAPGVDDLHCRELPPATFNGFIGAPSMGQFYALSPLCVNIVTEQTHRLTQGCYPRMRERSLPVLESGMTNDICELTAAELEDVCGGGTSFSEVKMLSDVFTAGGAEIQAGT
jgi:hypothetical protein